ncbi:hypothetical protein [Sphaerisporangium aureirubrum]|uniref:Secreted protein n=1 Tax=Sphaerisporangium aureirubrum TaxID=1544736 RepID=A0ABW1NRB3_9ACTN
MTSKLVTRILLALCLPVALLATAAPAQAAGPYCIPEAPVCAGLSGGTFVFTIKPPPLGTFMFSATVNGARANGSMSAFTVPGYMQGWFYPSPPLVSGDVFCMTFHAYGVPPGPYCGTA